MGREWSLSFPNRFCYLFLIYLQAVVASLQTRALGGEPRPGQGEDAGRTQIEHPQIGPDCLPSCHAAPQQGARRAEQRLQRERLTLRGAPALGARSVQLDCTGEGGGELQPREARTVGQAAGARAEHPTALLVCWAHPQSTVPSTWASLPLVPACPFLVPYLESP